MPTGPLIPNPTTRLDERVNRAHELAVLKKRRQYVWAPDDDDDGPILIADWRPKDDACVLVDPLGFALLLAPGASEP